MNFCTRHRKTQHESQKPRLDGTVAPWQWLGITINGPLPTPQLSKGSGALVSGKGRLREGPAHATVVARYNKIHMIVCISMVGLSGLWRALPHEKLCIIKTNLAPSA